MACAASLTCFISVNGMTQSNTIAISPEHASKYAQLTAMYTRLKESIEKMHKSVGGVHGQPSNPNPIGALNQKGYGYISFTLMTMSGINPPNTIQKIYLALADEMVMDAANDFRIMKENWEGPPPYALHVHP